jgi:hypothetical protein
MNKVNFNLRNVAMIVACFAATTMFSGCEPKEEPNGELLPGQVFITPAGPVAAGNLLVAVYTEGDILEEEATQVTFQWKKGDENINSGITTAGNQSGYTPTTPGEYYVIVSAPGYESKTSNVVAVTEAPADGPGISVASKYRGTYSTSVIGLGDGCGICVYINENNITWTGDCSEGNFPNVSTGSDKTMTWALGGSWAYLYSGSNKIGLIYTYSAYGFATLQNFLIGRDKVEQYRLTVLSSMGITSVDISDIDENVPDMEGEIES